MSIWSEIDSAGQERQIIGQQLSLQEQAPVVLDEDQVGAGEALGRGFLGGTVRTASALDMAAGGLAVGLDALAGDGSTEWQDMVFSEHDETFGRTKKILTPKPEEVTTAGQIAFGLTQSLTELAGGGGAGLVATEQLNTAEDMVNQGVDSTTAQAAGGIAGVANAIGVALPGTVGNTLTTRLLSGAGINVVSGAAAEGGQKELLDQRGYQQMADQIDPFDLKARSIDALMGVAFGGLAHLGAPESTPSQKNSAATLNLAAQAEGAAPGRPVDIGDMTAHTLAFEKAQDDLLSDRPVDVSAELAGARFEPDPRREALRQEVAKAADEALREEGQPSAYQPADDVAPVDPNEAAQVRQSIAARKMGLDAEQAKALERPADTDPLTGLYSDEELLPALGRAAKDSRARTYVESDLFNLGGVNKAMGANSKANAVIRAVGDAYARAFAGNPVFRRRGARFAAIVPADFDTAGALAQVDAEVAKIAEQYGLTDIPAARAPGMKGIQLFSGRSAIEQGATVDQVISPAQNELKAAQPQELSDVERAKAFQDWLGASGGQAGRVAARAAEARRGNLREGSGGGEGAAGHPRALEPALRNDIHEPAGRLLSPDALRDQEQTAQADRLGLSPEQRSRFRQDTRRDPLTGWFTDRDRAPTVLRAQELAAKTGTESSYVSVDISNLGGLNEALGAKTADDVFRGMANIVLDAARGLPDVDVIPFRHGGDEISLVIVGADEKAIRGIMDKAAGDVQRYANAIGVQDLPHAKYLGDTSKYGSGVYVGVRKIGPHSDIDTIFDEADTLVEANKSAGKVDVNGERLPLAGSRAAQAQEAGTTGPKTGRPSTAAADGNGLEEHAVTSAEQAIAADPTVPAIDETTGEHVPAGELLARIDNEIQEAAKRRETMMAAAACFLRNGGV